MAKSTRKKVLADVEKIQAVRRKKKLKEHYDRWVALAAKADTPENKEHYIKLAEDTLAQINASEKGK